ncbi:hypothetical protein EC973_007103 [Apophysomyces ossiformis]|uniref:UBX domain-containing protein n=1 Tax=Apophysomyces ossiformis TaxID=679940 RepID=A0A8H7BZB7_9FUNG|nr:hypothetical protein EC973_007103 [Apophysomyces ossiformis]
MNDDKLAQLLSLGFSIDVCTQALSQYSDVQDAADWILTTMNMNEPTPTGIPADTSQSPELVQGILSEPEPMDTTEVYQLGQHQQPAVAHNPEAEKEIARQRDLSRKMAKEVKRAKQLDEESLADLQMAQARRRTLLQFKEDRERQKLVHGSSRATTREENRNSSERTRIVQEIQEQNRLDRLARVKVLEDIKRDQQDRKSRSDTMLTQRKNIPLSVPSQQKKPSEAPFAIVQFKLSNGKTVREKFPQDALLKSLCEFAENEETKHNRALKNAESIELISAFPKRVFTREDGDLTVRDAGFVPNVSLNVSRIQPNPPGNSSQREYDISSGVMDHPMTETIPPAGWDEDDDMAEADNSDTSDTDGSQDLLDHGNRPIAINSHRSVRPAQPIHFSRRGRITNPHWNWGSEGHRLNDDHQDVIEEQNNRETEVIDETQRRQSLLSAIENRTKLLPIEQHATSKKPRSVRSLKDFCSVAVAGLLTQPKAQLKRLSHATPEVANIVLSELIRSRKLERSCMERLACHCYLQQVVLDSYIYATDSLLEAISLSMSSSSLTKLSLRGCDMVTDGGIRWVEGLKNLEHLDVSNCKITDKGLDAFIRLQRLSDNAKFKPELEVLLLDGCQDIRSERTFSSLQVSHAVALRFLFRVRVCADNVQCRSNFKADQPLLNLDLTGFLQVTDEGVRYIARMRSLRYLSLDGTKVTDEGVIQLGDLLDLEQLYLDRTSVSDVGLSKITGLSKLTTLSLSATRVSDAGLCLIGDSEQTKFTRNLRTLNLSHCRQVSDKGVQGLAGILNLANLNLDHTGVSRQCLRHLENLQHLKPVRLLGVNREEAEDQS